MASQLNTTPVPTTNLPSDFPTSDEYEHAEIVAKLLDRVGGADDLSFRCPCCRMDLSPLGRDRRAARHLDDCFWDLGKYLTGQLHAIGETRGLYDCGTPRTVTHHRKQIDVDGARFAVGREVAVLTPEITTDVGARQYPAARGTVTAIRERRQGRERLAVDLDLVRVHAWDDQGNVVRRTVTVSADRCCPVQRAGAGR